VVADPNVDPGLTPGEAKTIHQTRIPAALGRREPEFVAEADGSRTTMLVPMRSRRGHDLGWIGLTLPATATLPAAEAVRRRIEALNEGAG
jgi:hypothetical protein